MASLCAICRARLTTSQWSETTAGTCSCAYWAFARPLVDCLLSQRASCSEGVMSSFTVINVHALSVSCVCRNVGLQLGTDRITEGYKVSNAKPDGVDCLR
eukprot:6186402-Pleurochrysis_carterae.AAC.2